MNPSAISQVIHHVSQNESFEGSHKSFNRFNFRIAECQNDIAIAKKILWDAHHSRNSQKIDFPPSQEIFTAKSIIFILEENRRPVGTFSLIIDSEKKLPADLTFSKELLAFRTPLKSLSEICSLGVTKECKFKKDMMFFAIFLATMQNFALNISDCVVTVKENHKHFYNGLNFIDLSEEKISARTGAIVQLLAINNKIASQNSGLNQKAFCLQKAPDTKSFWKFILRNIDEFYISKVLKFLKNKNFLIETEKEMLIV